MAQAISKKELALVRNFIIGTHGITNYKGTRSVLYYVFKLNEDVFGALWSRGIDLYDLEFMSNATKSKPFPFAKVGTRKEIAIYCKKSIKDFIDGD